MIWQTKTWGEMLLATKQVEKIIQVDNIYIEKRQIGLNKFGLFVLGYNGEITQKLAEKLQDICNKEQAIFIQIENNDYTEKKYIHHSNTLKKGYYKKFITPFTTVIDLEKTTDEILSLMKPKGRYNIKLATKKGIIVKKEEKNKNNTKIFFELMSETTSRDNFSGNNVNYYEKFLENITESELFIAYKDDIPVAAGIFIFKDSIAIYYYGASTSKKEYRNLMAPYLLQWTAIEYAQEKGCIIYDFLGIASPDEKNSPLAGVTDFKLKLSKDTREVSQSFILINKRFHYTIIKFLRYIKNLRK